MKLAKNFLVLGFCAATLAPAICRQSSTNYGGVQVTANEMYLYSYAMGYAKAYYLGWLHPEIGIASSDDLKIYNSEQQGRLEQQQHPKSEFLKNFSSGLGAGETDGFANGSHRTAKDMSNGGPDYVLLQQTKLAVFDQAQKRGITNAKAVEILDNYQKPHESFRRF